MRLGKYESFWYDIPIAEINTLVRQIWVCKSLVSYLVAKTNQESLND